jgi:hypothetical protein
MPPTSNLRHDLSQVDQANVRTLRFWSFAQLKQQWHRGRFQLLDFHSAGSIGADAS